MNCILPTGFLEQVKPTYVEVGVSDRFAAGWVHSKTVPFAIIATPLRGKYEITCEGQTAIINPGEAFLTAPGQRMRIVHHHATAGGGGMASQWVHFSATVLDLLDLASFFVLPLKLPRQTAQLPISMIGDMLALAERPMTSPLASISWNRLVWRLIDFLCQTFELRKGADALLRGPAKLRPLLLHLRSRLEFPMSAAAMAEFAGLSPSHLHHTFKRLAGVGPVAYLKRLRLEEAARRLMNGDQSITEISLSVGFSNPFHFSREFKRQFRVAPRLYRQLHLHPSGAHAICERG